jgi:hypothetical protein
MALEFTSSTWKAVEDWANERLKQHRARLEGPLDERTTTDVRARINEQKALLALAKPQAPAEPPADHWPAA